MVSSHEQPAAALGSAKPRPPSGGCLRQTVPGNRNTSKFVEQGITTNAHGLDLFEDRHAQAGAERFSLGNGECAGMVRMRELGMAPTPTRDNHKTEPLKGSDELR